LPSLACAALLVTSAPAQAAPGDATGSARSPPGPRSRPHAACGLSRAALPPGAYGKWGFADSVNVDTQFASRARLSLDQGMIMAALGNALGGDVLRDAFAGGDVASRIRPVVGVEEFNVQPRGCTITGTEGNDRLTGTDEDDVICGLGGDDRVDGGTGTDHEEQGGG
jgi:hypothetical protein